LVPWCRTARVQSFTPTRFIGGDELLHSALLNANVREAEGREPVERAIAAAKVYDRASSSL
jgi:hypothetical protein